MAAENFLAKENLGNNHRVKQLTSKSGVVTYTAKTGRPTDGFVIDSVIRVTTGATYNMAITLPDGVYHGQECFIFFEVEGSAETVSITSTTGDNGTNMTAVGGYNLFVWAGSTIGWIKVAYSAT